MEKGKSNENKEKQNRSMKRKQNIAKNKKLEFCKHF